MKLLYAGNLVKEVLSNHSMSVEEMLEFTDIDIYEENNGDLVWDYELFTVEA